MVKNKRKKQPAQTDRPATKKSHEPTAFEVAFRDADARKKNDTATKKAVTVSTPTAKAARQIHKTIPHKPSAKINPPPSTPAPPKEKRVYIPPPKAAKKKKTTIALQQPTKKQQNLTKSAPSAARKKPPVKLGLKPVLDKTLILDAGISPGDKQKHGPIKGHKIKGLAGKSQVHDGSYNDEIDIVIGFDFGTSSSKIVIRDQGRQTAYAVHFGPLACSGNSYLIPTNIFISDDGNLSLSAGRHPYSDLKIHLMDNPEQNVFTARNTADSITASELAAGYMALVIRSARAWFLKRTKSIYKKTNIQWSINMGISSKNYDDQKRKNTFQTVAMAAWRISRMDSAITIAEVKKHLQKASNIIAVKGKDIDPDDYESLWLHPDFVNTHPEVIMEVVGYVRSPSRTSGLHLLVDIGATTLDSATFIIHKQDGEDVFPLLETKVERYGTMILHNRRIQALKNKLQKTLQHKNSIDPTTPLPSSAHYEIRASKNDLSENDDSFFKQCSKQIGTVIRETKKQRDPNSIAWEGGLPIFICGGGGRVPAYRTMVKNIGVRITKNLTDFKGFIKKEIPKPDQLDAPDLPHQEYDRLAVAYGLSFTMSEIGEVIPESQISNIHKVVKTHSIEDRFVSKDMC